MIEFKKLTIQNFLSFGQKPITIDLNQHKNTLIIGQNSDTGSEGYSRNGVGKSSIFQALCWVLYNQGLSNIKQDAFVNVVNKKKMMVTLELTVDGKEFVIRRGRKPAVLEVLKEGNPYTMHSVDTVDETIESLIGISFDTFTNTVMLNTNTIPFMNMKPAPQRNFMEQMLGLDILTERANKIKAQNKDIAVDIKLEEQNIEHQKKNYEKTKEQIDRLVQKEKDWKNNIEERIARLTKENKEIDEIDLDEMRQEIEDFEAVQEKLKEVKDSLTNLDNEEKQEYESRKQDIDRDFEKKIGDVELALKEKEYNKNNQYTDLMKEKEERMTSLNEDKELIDEMKSYISTNEPKVKRLVSDSEKLLGEIEKLKEGTCPFCGQEHFDETKLNELEEKKKESDKEIDGINETLNEIYSQKEEIETRYEKNKKEIESHFKDAFEKLEKDFEEETISLKDKKKRYNEEWGAAVADVRNFLTSHYSNKKDELNTQKRELESVKKPEFNMQDTYEIENTYKENKKRIDELNSEDNPYADEIEETKKHLIDCDKTKLYELQEREEHGKMLVKLLTDNKSFVRRNLLNQYIPYINKMVEHYLDELELPHRVTFNDDLSVDIEYMTQSVSYGNMSNGERGRLNFAVSMAFRDLMSVTNNQFNFLGIDELLDNGIDQSGFHAIFKILNRKENSNTFLISHRDDLLSEVDNILTIEKNNGFTNVH